MKKTRTVLLVFCLAATAAWAGKPSSRTHVVDSGSFGIFLDGKRIGTETFKIEQGTDVHVATAEMKIESGDTKAVQSSEMKLAPNGDLRHYEWQDSGPNKSLTTVDPNEEFMLERMKYEAGTKTSEIPYWVPLSTVILDDNFFSQRELLVWRYLAAACVRPKDGPMTCNRTQFGIVIPHQHVTNQVWVSVVGPEKLNYKGADVDTNKLKLETDNGDWILWTDKDYKLLKIKIAAANTEVIRD